MSSNAILLDPEEPPPVAIHQSQGRSPFLLIGDHAGRRIPRRLQDLGLGADDLARHIAWDIGVRGLGTMLAERLDAVFIHQVYSRLVIDCNRQPASAEAIPTVSDHTEIAGNQGLTEVERQARIAQIHDLYQAAIAAEIAARQAAGTPVVLVSLHSFTPVMAGAARPWHAGVLHDGWNDRLARDVLAHLQGDPTLNVGDNEPYRMDGTDYTVPRHAFAADLPYVELEIRQDLITTIEGQQRWCAILAAALLSVWKA